MQTHHLLPRHAEPALANMLETFPVVVVTGARQTGKSTLVRERLPGDHVYLTLDDVLLRDEARRDPELFLDRGGRLIVDEVQRAPDLLLAIKRRVDERRERGRYVLTGSADVLLQRGVAESLAGRAGYLRLTGLTRREQLGMGRVGLWSELLATPSKAWPDLLRSATPDAEPWEAFAQRGGYPVPAHDLATTEQRQAWFAGYAATYLERDLRAMSAVENLADMRRLMTALCLRSGSLLNQAEVARDLGLPPSTVQRFVNLLEVSYQVVRVPAYGVNRTRRLVKAPKVYWSDSGLALHLAGESAPRGAHLETLVLADLLAWAGVDDRRPTILHWRTASGAEVDFVIELPQWLLPVEVKATRRPTHSDARHLRSFMGDHPAAVAGLLLHGGDELTWLDRGVLAAPWWRVL